MKYKVEFKKQGKIEELGDLNSFLEDNLKNTLKDVYEQISESEQEASAKWEYAVSIKAKKYKKRAKRKEAPKAVTPPIEETPVQEAPEVTTPPVEEKVKAPKKKVKPVKPDLPKKPTIKRKKETAPKASKSKDTSKADNDAEEVATITSLIDSVERGEMNRKSGKPVGSRFKIDKMIIENFYGEMLRIQEQGLDKWNTCIIKYQDAFTVHAFIGAVDSAKKTGQRENYQFGTNRTTLANVYIQMKESGLERFATAIKAYEDTFYLNK